MARTLVLAAGLGTRLRPLTDRVPKCLVPVAGRPLLDYWQDAFARDGLLDARINVHAHAEQVRAWVAARNAEGPVAWSVFEEPALLGSGGTLRANLAWLEGSDDGVFVVVYADNASAVDFRALLAFHRERAAEVTMALFDAPDPRACGIATLDAEDRIVDFVEKPSAPASTLANAGIYAVSTGALDEALAHAVPKGDVLDLGHDVLPRLAGRMHGFRIDGYHRDVGTPEALAEIERDVRAGALRARAQARTAEGRAR